MIFLTKLDNMWVARDKNNILCVYNTKPIQVEEGYWSSNPTGDVEKDLDFHYDYLQIDENEFPNLKYNDEPKEVNLFSFDELVEVLCPPKHDGKTYGLFTEMLAEKMKYTEINKFSSYEEEKQYMINYLKDHWNDVKIEVAAKEDIENTEK